MFVCVVGGTRRLSKVSAFCSGPNLFWIEIVGSRGIWTEQGDCWTLVGLDVFEFCNWTGVTGPIVRGSDVRKDLTMLLN